MSDATFKSADHALKQTFRVLATPIIKNASITAVMTGGSPPPGLLSAQEKHGQAAMTMGYILRLPQTYLAYILALYGWREVRPPAFDHLALYVAVGTDESVARAYRTIVEQYFSSRKTEIRGIRKALKVHNYDALAIRRVAFKRLDTVHAQAMDTVTCHMEAQGLIAGSQ